KVNDSGADSQADGIKPRLDAIFAPDIAGDGQYGQSVWCVLARLRLLHRSDSTEDGYPSYARAGFAKSIWTLRGYEDLSKEGSLESHTVRPSPRLSTLIGKAISTRNWRWSPSCGNKRDTNLLDFTMYVRATPIRGDVPGKPQGRSWVLVLLMALMGCVVTAGDAKSPTQTKPLYPYGDVNTPLNHYVASLATSKVDFIDAFILAAALSYLQIPTQTGRETNEQRCRRGAVEEPDTDIGPEGGVDGPQWTRGAACRYLVR
ncbi:hypothetical protein THAOC_06341, partial [Thalassiosira oceanica]